MITEIALSLVPEEADGERLYEAAARHVGVDRRRILGLAQLQRSVDARRRHTERVLLQIRLRVAVDEPLPEPEPLPELKLLSGLPRVAIIGAGPAGLYAAYTLARLGVKSVVLERGRKVSARRRDVAALSLHGELNLESNYCFGEGGAGTFSDGKLYTRATKRGDIKSLFELFVACGAPASILYEARPHLGTDRLPGMISAWREMLEAVGVEFKFDSKITGLQKKSGRVVGVTLASGELVSAEAVVLSTGHSAHDLYEVLDQDGVAIRSKPFAMGVRLEHPQPLIDHIQYGKYAGHQALGAASYTLKQNVKNACGYSFCMCPGGHIVPASTAAGRLVVNGMSTAQRNSPFANSGFVVTISPEVFGSDAPLAGLHWQQSCEVAAYKAGGGGFIAPAQRLTDLLSHKASRNLPKCSYHPGVTPSDLRAVLPPVCLNPMVEALREIGRKMPGFITEEAIAVGVESRSSVPLQIVRSPETCESVNTPGLYPCGEGAGYAGGITSAALDGARVAQAIAANLR